MKNLLLSLRTNDLDEVVFANRNKSYGAYALRNDYSNQLTKALFIGIAFFASVSAVPLVMNAFKSEVLLPKDDFSGREILVINDTETPKPKPDNTTPVTVKTVANPEVTPVREIQKKTSLPTKKDFEGAAIGSETKDGPETTFAVAPPISVGPPAVTPYQPPVAPPARVEDPNVIIDGAKADVAADFKGGINAFRQKVAQGFDTSSIDQSGMVSATITFVVEKDGSISNIKITGANADFNQEAERTVKSIKTKWTPAQLKGKAVRSSFRMPVSMRIE
ncbi:energy transducer TonB [Epilithonimonas hominis]|uniref:Energy transducer TonB n=1 Tax=Epilithonimonas hominis TaxID=420404 RepID=A0A3N0XAH1_9FLAO|nr:energy transducer TonB [Epilithonimonas hominis]ROI13771.1 energy transducer TonB [Epilithonimonas hominis]